MINDKAKIHYPHKDIGKLFTVSNPNKTRSMVRITICGHMYDAGIISDIMDDVTCKSCYKQILLQENRWKPLMHYIAPGKRNLVWHLANFHKEILHDEKELKKWTVEELEKTHKEQHENLI